MRRFEIIREEDESGVSGTGLVAQGIEFDCGKVALTWISHLGTVAVYDNVTTVKKVHGHGGKTRLVFLDKDDHEDETISNGEQVIPEVPDICPSGLGPHCDFEHSGND
jgi:hypothetical protein